MNIPDFWKLVIAALLGGAATVGIEAYVRPRLAGRSLAELLVHDLARQFMAAIGERDAITRDSTNIPQPKPFLLHVYFAVVPRLVELPPGLIGPVSAFYNLLERANERASHALRLHETLLATTAAETRTLIAHDLANHLALYSAIIDNALARLEALQPLLQAAAFPDWSARANDAPKPRALDETALAAKRSEINRTVAARAELIVARAARRAAGEDLPPS